MMAHTLSEDIVVLADIDSAYQFLNDEQDNIGSYRILVIHPAVKEYLSEKNIYCNDLSEFIDDITFKENYDKAESILIPYLNLLDRKGAPKLSACLGIEKIEWFYSLYRISAKYDFFGLLNAISALCNFFDKYPPRKIIVYGENSFSILNSKGDLVFLIHSVLDESVKNSNYDLQSRSIYSTPQNGYRNAIVKIKSKAFQTAVNGLHLIAELRNFLDFFRAKSITILFESLYDFKFLRLTNKIGPTLIWAYHEDPWVLDKPVQESHTKVSKIKQVVSSLEFAGMLNHEDSITSIAIDILIRRIKTDLGNNVTTYADSLLKMKHLLQTKSKIVAIWGNDPAIGKKALLIDFLLKSKVPVIGYQHGASYGVQSDFEHFHSAYIYCNIFLSYGFTKEDLSTRITNDSKFNATIEPVGSVRIQTALSKKASNKNVLATATLFYPVTNVPGILCTSKRRKADKFLDLQKKILSFLDSKADTNHYIKLPPGTIDTPSCHELSFYKYPKLNLVSSKVLTFMNKYNTKAVLIDACFSTCMYEVLGYDCEVFVIHDDLVPFDKKPLELLKKRVYYIEKIDHFYELYTMYIEGQLEKRRDNEFFEKYVVNISTDSKKKVITNILQAFKN